MPATHRHSSAGEKYTNPTVTMTKPTGTAEGDILFAWFVNVDPARVITGTPSGWSLSSESKSTVAPNTAMWVFTKKAGASEPATYDFTWDYGFNGRAGIAAYQDGDTISVIGTVNRSGTIADSPFAITATGITTPVNDCLLVFIGGTRVATSGAVPSHSMPSDFAQRIASGNDYDPRTTVLADKLQATAGASGNAVGQLTRPGSGTGQTHGVLFAISPTGGATTALLSGSAEAPIPTTVALSQTTLSVAANNTSELIATVLDQRNNPLPHLTLTVSSSSTGVATGSQAAITDSTGKSTINITTLSPGNTTLTIGVDGATATCALSVAPASSVQVSISPTAVTMYPGSTYQFTGSVNDDDTGVTWSIVSGDGSISSSGLFEAPAVAGQTVIRATSGDVYAEAVITTEGLLTTTVTANFGAGVKTLRYIIQGPAGSILATGIGTTNALGDLTVTVSAEYSGQLVAFIVNNLTPAMTTAGRGHRQKVVTVS